MFNKLSNPLLFIIFALLGGIVAYMFLVDDKKPKRSYKADLVTIDTSAVTSISLFGEKSGGEEIKLARSDDGWTVTPTGGVAQEADKNKIKSLLGSLLEIKPKRVTSRSKEKWAEYEVDGPKASRVIVQAGSKTVADLYVGKFSFQQRQPPPGQQQDPRMQMQQQQQQPILTSYVRVADDDAIYAVEGILNVNFNRAPADFLPPPPEPVATDSTAVEGEAVIEGGE